MVVTRGLTYVPIYVLGFGDGPLFAYLVVVSAQALLDVLFGTAHMPDRWPSAYGSSGGPPPPGYVRQFRWPFTSHP